MSNRNNELALLALQNDSEQISKIISNKMMIAKAYRNAAMQDNVMEIHKANELAKSYHIGFRKCGQIPEFQHQTSIALHYHSLCDNLENHHIGYILAFLHDSYEDADKIYKQTGLDVIKELETDFNISKYIEMIKLLSKHTWNIDYIDNQIHFNKQSKGLNFYFNEMVNCVVENPHVLIIKCLDRINNLSSMTACFTYQRMREYIQEVHDYFIPAIEQAKAILVIQHQFDLIKVLTNLEITLKMQCTIIGDLLNKIE